MRLAPTLVVAAVAVCLAGRVTPAHATTARALALDELVQAADATVLGHAVTQDSFWQGTRIMTLVRVELEEIWAGRIASGAPYVDVLTLGGVVGELGQRVDGAASLPPGDHVVLHLRAGKTGEYYPVAMAQGVWKVVPSSGAPGYWVQRPGVDRLVPGPKQAPMPTTLAALKRAVMEAAQRRERP